MPRSICSRCWPGGENQRDSWCWARIGQWMLWYVGILCKVSSKSCTSTGSAQRSRSNFSVSLRLPGTWPCGFRSTASRMS